MKNWRHQLHTIPELNYCELETSKYIYDKLTSFGITIISKVAGTGIIGVLESEPITSNKNIALRAELDGLPIEETTNLEYSSKNSKRMHACGHDGHMAILLGVAEYFSKNKNTFNGIITFIFSPAEEEGAGCKKMLLDYNFDIINEVYAIHNWPGLAVGEISIPNNTIMAGDDNFEIKINGKGGHGAMPELANNPISYIGKVVHSLAEIQNEIDGIVLTPTSIDGAQSFNVIQSSINIKGTLRYLEQKSREKVHQKLQLFSLKNPYIDISFIEGYPPTINDKNCATLCRSLMSSKYSVKTELPSMATEDFSYLLQKKPGCYAWLGCRDKNHQQELHNSSFDFNDEILEIGYDYFITIVKNRLQ